ncbi:MAG: GNAT family N-acetyltransferase [Lachnospiraceae bacterium]|nr:GNAT family N-acetyltransferase [Lachnospiraceae bacterium]
MIFEVKSNKRIEALFAGWQETLIWSCLQNIMGHLYADSEEHPNCAMALQGDFCLFTGEPNEELVAYKPDWCQQNFVIMVPGDESWAALIEQVYGDRAKKVERYAIKKEPGVFDKEKLQKIVEDLPPEYELTMMNETLFYECKKIDWCRDWVSLYADYEMYQKYGLGVVILRNGDIVSGASSYSGYQGGIEIQIDTKETERRKGLAYICGAKLILECLERGWYPSWDAQNLWSVALAEKLGYHFDHVYPAYEIKW